MAESAFAPRPGNPSVAFVETMTGSTQSFPVTSTGTNDSSTGTRQEGKAEIASSQDNKSIAAGAPTLSKIETILCGSTAGVVSRFVIAPLDVVKIRLQGLWKGNMAAEYLYLTYGGIQFLVYQQTKALLSKTAENATHRVAAKHLSEASIHAFTVITNSSSIQSFISGASAGIVATACTYPFDLLRTRFAIQRDVKIYTGVPQAFRHILQKDGLKGFYRGMAPALIQVIPYMGVMFGSYDTLKQLASWLKEKADSSSSAPPSSLASFPQSSSQSLQETRMTSTSDPPLKSAGQFLLGLEDMLCGAISGVVSKTAVYPLDMVRKRMQIQGSEQQKANLGVFTASSTVSSSGTATSLTAAETMPTTVWRCMVQIVRQEGYLALYKGLLPGILKAAPASAVTFLVFSQTGALLERLRRPDDARDQVS
ncbi:mitochondrial thiamine pyrophosphate transporter [Mortierella claussenii]|nr:mitochondrial thiamine pyrophosphate transporter [Mortierella claussenii]